MRVLLLSAFCCQAWSQAPQEIFAVRGLLIDWLRIGSRGEFSLRSIDFRVHRCRFDENTSMERTDQKVTAEALKAGDWVDMTAERMADIPVCYARTLSVYRPARESIARMPLPPSRPILDNLFPRGNLTFSGLVREINPVRISLRIRGRADQFLRLRPDTTFTFGGLPAQASWVPMNAQVFVRAGRSFDGDLEAYHIVWGHILRADRAARPAPPAPPIEAGLARYIFKTVEQHEVSLKVDYPPDWKAEEKRPAMLVFDGGGPPEEFAQKGLVVFRVGARSASPMPEEAVEDARSAMRWVRGNARAFGVDPQRIVATGGASGSLQAMGLYSLNHFNGSAEDQLIPTRPCALLLHAPLLEWHDLDALRGDRRRAARLSPARYWRGDMPPTLIILGSKDHAETARRFVARWKGQGAPIELWEEKRPPSAETVYARFLLAALD
ncbi:MAG: alpha/beta hydrolase [Bryobacteraceae bacterium]